ASAPPPSAEVNDPPREGELVVQHASAPPPSAAVNDPPREGELVVQPGAGERPPLRMTFPYENEATLFGYGEVQLWARPERDEIRVGAIIDAPSGEARWARC